jgi:peptidoglycan L-alanyl-D-glutamate endopeptidase CwlK
MSSPLFAADVLFSQRLLASAGLYVGNLDGDFGPVTAHAEAAFDALFVQYQVKYGIFDKRSEINISTLLPKMQIAARRLMGVARDSFKVGTVQILSGTRSYTEQDVLFAKRPKVTNARGGQSNHNFGIAVDVGIFVGGKYYTGANATESRAYSDLAKVIKPALGFVSAKRSEDRLLDWGGDWKSIVDMPHYELHTGKSTSQVRALLEAGKPYV